MKTTNTIASLSEAKKVISQKTKAFEGRLMKAKNDFEIVVILDEMIHMIEAEIFGWVNMVEQTEEEGNDDNYKLISEAAVHISDLQSLIETFNKYRAASIVTALKIQSAMINCHQLKEPIIKDIL